MTLWWATYQIREGNTFHSLLLHQPKHAHKHSAFAVCKVVALISDIDCNLYHSEKSIPGQIHVPLLLARHKVSALPTLIWIYLESEALQMVPGWRAMELQR